RRARQLGRLGGRDGTAQHQSDRHRPRRRRHALPGALALHTAAEEAPRGRLPGRGGPARSPTGRAAGTMTRQLAILLGAFAIGTAIAAALGAVSFGVALGIGQLCFAATLVWVLLRD